MDHSVGNKLREARGRRKLSLEEVEAETKIRTRYLQAIENEDWDQLPEDTYVRAFIRTYGRFLGLDGDRLAEEQRRARGAARPGEQLPRVDPQPHPVTHRRSRGARLGLSPRALAVAVTGAVAAALVVIGLATGGSSDSGSGRVGSEPDAKTAAPSRSHQQEKALLAGHTLKLRAQGEVWICLLNGKDRPLLNGVILNSGEAMGPFRSGSFTVALGNGAVIMTVDGQQAQLPEPSSPIGFAVRPNGSVHELPEGERPTCA